MDKERKIKFKTEKTRISKKSEAAKERDKKLPKNMEYKTMPIKNDYVPAELPKKYKKGGDI